MTRDWINFLRVEDDSIGRVYRTHVIEEAYIGVHGFYGNSRRKEATGRTWT
jgi:hypothetical protein